jgi:hypothetical protein
MGYMKELMLKQEYQASVATDIAVEAGALERCEYHEDIVLDPMGDYTPAYKLGNYRFSQGQLRDVFESRTEMADAIKAAIDDACMFGCPYCAKMLHD